MPGSITPLPILDQLDEEDRQRYEALKPPTSIVVRYGYMKYVAELPYDGEAKPGCGSKLVVRTRRGIEIAEMLTTTCGNGGCGKNITRKQMLEYIENSGGKDYPFTNQGKVLRVATIEDLNEQSRLDTQKLPMIKFTRQLVAELDLPMKLVDIELLLGGERVIFHYVSENWIDFRELVRRLAAEYQTRIEMHQVNARDEARIVADYEKCGQHCCCKQFLKVLKPVSMRSAKVQKATLDPTKISGRCGRLMCCLRYEDETYESLRKKLPHKQTRVMTPEDGSGSVIDTQILTQLVLVRLDTQEVPQAYPLENLRILSKQEDAEIRAQQQAAGLRPALGPGGPGMVRPPREPREQGDRRGPRREPQRPQPGRPLRDDQVESREGEQSDALPEAREPRERREPRREPAPTPVPRPPEPDEADGGDEGEEVGGDAVESVGPESPDTPDTPETLGAPGEVGPDGQPRKKRRRRRRRRGRGGQNPQGGEGAPPAGPA